MGKYPLFMKWRNIIVKMTIPLKITSSVTEIPIKVLLVFITEPRKIIGKSAYKQNDSE